MKEHIPIIEVNKNNFAQIFPFMQSSIKEAYFISLDCEMSGLGDRKKISSKSVDDRYLALCQAAKTRSLLSIGLSCYSKIYTSKDNVLKLKATTFNILTLCNEDFTVEPKSLEFLVNHGFDFNLQYSKGIPYRPGADRPSRKSDDDAHYSTCLRQIFVDLILASKPIVLHNSLIDLIFLYYHLYGPLPSTLQSFLADLSQLFPAGLYDTKYIADYCARTKASFLEYIFRKCQRENSCLQVATRLSVRFSKVAEAAWNDSVEWSYCNRWSNKTYDENRAKNLCQAYSQHGCCLKESCELLHDVDLAIMDDEIKLERKRAKSRSRNQSRQRKLTTEEESQNDLNALSMATDSDSSHFSSVQNLKCNDPLTQKLMAMLESRRKELLEQDRQRFCKVQDDTAILHQDSKSFAENGFELKKSKKHKNQQKSDDLVSDEKSDIATLHQTEDIGCKEKKKRSKNVCKQLDNDISGNECKVKKLKTPRTEFNGSQSAETKDSDGTLDSSLKDECKVKTSSITYDVKCKSDGRHSLDSDVNCLNGALHHSSGSSFYKCAHRAGFDAFMTGYCLAYFSIKHYGLTNSTGPKFDIDELKHRIALSGKDFSLKVQASAFAKTSPYHDAKFQEICLKRVL